MIKNIIRYVGLALVIVGIVLVMKNLFANSSNTWSSGNNGINNKVYYEASIKLLDKETSDYVVGADLVLKDNNDKVIDEWKTTITLNGVSSGLIESSLTSIVNKLYVGKQDVTVSDDESSSSSSEESLTMSFDVAMLSVGSAYISYLYKDGLMFIHPDVEQLRSITIREAALLQTFPMDFEFIGSDAYCFKMIGNAVPVLFAKNIALSITKVLENEKNEDIKCTCSL